MTEITELSGRSSNWVGLVTSVTGLALAGILMRYGVYAALFPAPTPQGYLDALCVWDCKWYLGIAESGYMLEPSRTVQPGTANWAFFPLYPLLLAGVTTMTRLPILAAGFLLSNTLAIAAAIVARPLFRDARAYWLYVFMLLVGPYSFLFSTLYSEGLFVLLTILALNAFARDRLLTASALSALLSATRVTGVLFVFAILVRLIEQHLKAGGRLRNLPARIIGDPRLILSFLIAPLGLFAYMAFIRWHTGDTFAFAHIQRAWGRELGNPFENLWFSLLPPDGRPLNLVLAAWGAGTVVSFALCGALIVKRRYAEAAFCVFCLLVSLSAGVGSMVRFAAGLAPLGMVLAELLTRWRWLYYAAYPVMAALGVVIAIGWFRQSFFAM